MGEVFAGRYELVDPVGRGGAGAVWRAWDHRRRRYVAAKVLQQSDAHALLRFVREQALRIDHPHVLAPASWAADDDKVLFTMDLVAGGSLAHLIGDYGPLPPAFVCLLLDQLLSGLAAVHAEGVVHRDIKPANVLLEATGTGRPHLRLSDFGISMRKGEPRLTDTNFVVGTPGYFAPEQIVGSEPDFPADLFAVGLVALYLLQGAKPDAKALVDLFRAHGTPSAPKDIPEPLWQVIATLLQPDPDARFRTATGARKALAQASEMLPEPGPDDELVEVFDQIGPLPADFGPDGPLRGAPPVPGLWAQGPAGSGAHAGGWPGAGAHSGAGTQPGAGGQPGAGARPGAGGQPGAEAQPRPVPPGARPGAAGVRGGGQPVGGQPVGEEAVGRQSVGEEAVRRTPAAGPGGPVPGAEPAMSDTGNFHLPPPPGPEPGGGTGAATGTEAGAATGTGARSRAGAGAEPAAGNPGGTGASDGAGAAHGTPSGTGTGSGTAAGTGTGSGEALGTGTGTGSGGAPGAGSGFGGGAFTAPDAASFTGVPGGSGAAGAPHEASGTGVGPQRPDPRAEGRETGAGTGEEGGRRQGGGYALPLRPAGRGDGTGDTGDTGRVPELGRASGQENVPGQEHLRGPEHLPGQGGEPGQSRQQGPGLPGAAQEGVPAARYPSHPGPVSVPGPALPPAPAPTPVPTPAPAPGAAPGNGRTGPAPTPEAGRHAPHAAPHAPQGVPDASQAAPDAPPAAYAEPPAPAAPSTAPPAQPPTPAAPPPRPYAVQPLHQSRQQPLQGQPPHRLPDAPSSFPGSPAPDSSLTPTTPAQRETSPTRAYTGQQPHLPLPPQSGTPRETLAYDPATGTSAVLTDPEGAHADAARSAAEAPGPRAHRPSRRRPRQRRPGPSPKVAIPILLVALSCIAFGIWAVMQG